MKKELKVSITITEKEYIKLFFNNIFISPINIVSLIFGGLLAANVLRFFINQQHLTQDWPIFQMGIAFYLLILFPIFSYFLAKLAYSDSDLSDGVIHYKIDTQGVEIIGEGIKSNSNWEEFFKVRETKDCFIIYKTKREGHFLPKREFYNNDVSIFKEIVRQTSVKHNFKA